ncbi:MAG: VWA domain-containing protein [Acidobacteriota bacterium]|nr:VWA domain-containing protein [Blastocatellia bacterium]MDW8413432.1 VWA domain-containing protein [Acidobacteriota bacterium]
MRKELLALLAFALTAFAQGNGGDTVTRDETTRIKVTNVTLPVIVTDKDGRFVSNLTKENFEVYEDKKLQKIQDFQAQADLPLYIAILLDTSASVKGKLKFEKEAVTSFLQTVLRRRKDQALLVTFDSNVEMRQDFTDDLELLIKALKPVKAAGETTLYDAVYRVCEEKMSNVPTPRKVIVVISDGADTASERTLEEAIEIAQRNEVVIFGISTKGAGFFGIEGGQVEGVDDKELRRLCEETGGEVAFPGNYLDLERAFANINNKSRKYYLLAYEPEDPERPGYRRIEVKIVGRKDLKLRTRKGYNIPARVEKRSSGGEG